MGPFSACLIDSVGLVRLRRVVVVVVIVVVVVVLVRRLLVVDGRVIRVGRTRLGLVVVVVPVLVVLVVVELKVVLKLYLVTSVVVVDVGGRVRPVRRVGRVLLCRWVVDVVVVVVEENNDVAGGLSKHDVDHTGLFQTDLQSVLPDCLLREPYSQHSNLELYLE